MSGITLDEVILDAATSNIAISDGTDTLAINPDGSINVSFSVPVADDEADSGNPLKVGGRGVSGLLTALSATNDRFDMTGDLYRRVFVNNSYNVGHEVTTETVGVAAAEIVAVPLAGRKNMTIQNVSSSSVWLGTSGAVTADDTATGGLEIPKGASYTDDFGENIDVFLISTSAGRTVKVHEKG